METLQILPYSLKQILPSTIVTSSKGQTTGALKNRIAIYDFGEQDLELLNKFHTRTVFTITTDKNLHSYQTETVKLACSVRSPNICPASPTNPSASASVLNAWLTVINTNARPLPLSRAEPKTLHHRSLSLVPGHSLVQPQDIRSDPALGARCRLRDRGLPGRDRLLLHRGEFPRGSLAAQTPLIPRPHLAHPQRRQKRTASRHPTRRPSSKSHPIRTHLPLPLPLTL